MFGISDSDNLKTYFNVCYIDMIDLNYNYIKFLLSRILRYNYIDNAYKNGIFNK